jgi:tetratricopeptide (TPR) repeat protein
MKTFLRITILFALILTAVTTIVAQRVIKGTVYMDGKLAAGITVEAHKGGKMMTSFDGLYEVEATAKTKWIKFTFIDESKKLIIEGKPGDTFNFAFTGEIPSENQEEVSGNVSLQSMEELLGGQDKDFMNGLSLYTEFYKQKDYDSALPHWKELYNKYPKCTPNLYIHGAKMFEYQLANAKTDAEKDKILDDYMKLYDKRIKNFGNQGYVLGRKGTTWLKYKLLEGNLEGDEQVEALKSGYEWINQSVDEQGNKSELPVLVLLMQTSKALFKLGALPKETVVFNYEKCNSILKYNFENETDADKLEKANKVQVAIEDIFGKSGAADCEALVSIFTPQFEENITDVEFIKNMLRKLRRAKCDDSDLYEKATGKLYELEPSAEAAFNMAHRYLKLNDLEKAKGYYKQAIEQETDQDLLSNYYYEYAYFIFAKESALKEARAYGKKALAINPKYCEANMLIGDIYVAASKNFEGSNLEKAAVFWVAVDYFNKARREEGCTIEAGKKVSTYKKYFPNKEDAFMDGLQAGKSYKVEGWINETTKVRF